MDTGAQVNVDGEHHIAALGLTKGDLLRSQVRLDCVLCMKEDDPSVKGCGKLPISRFWMVGDHPGDGC